MSDPIRDKLWTDVYMHRLHKGDIDFRCREAADRAVEDYDRRPLPPPPLRTEEPNDGGGGLMEEDEPPASDAGFDFGVWDRQQSGAISASPPPQSAPQDAQPFSYIGPDGTGCANSTQNPAFAPQASQSAPGEAFGCHCDLEPEMKPDGCVWDYGNPKDCVNASRGIKRDDCEHWRPIHPPPPTARRAAAIEAALREKAGGKA